MKAYRLTYLIFPLLAPFTSGWAQAADSVGNTLRALRIEEDFEITGKLDQPIWQQADVAYISYEVSPDDDAPALVKTEVRVLYSEDKLYIGFKAYDPKPSKIRATIAERDRAFGQDYVGLLLDTYGSRQQAYEFFVTPLGIQMDLYRTTSGGEDISFNALWFSEAFVSDSGYTAVMKIPFKSLDFPERDIQDWTVQFFRNYPRSVRHQLLWTDVNREDVCLLCQNGELANIRGIEAENTVEILPYVAAFQSSELEEPGNLSSGLDHGPVNVEVGGSISYAPTSTMSIDAVINPDFSQVETDATRISVNETFALFYPEKRPFFLKEAALFETPEALFYSRTINNPLVAGKFTQKTAEYSIAFLTALDENTPFIIPGLYESDVVSSEVNSYSNVLRGRYNFGSESYVGGLVTTRNLSEGANYVGGIDWLVRLFDNYYVEGQLAYTQTQESADTALFNSNRELGNTAYNAAFNGEEYDGRLVDIELIRKGKNLYTELEYMAVSPTFQAHLGFINKVNRRSYTLEQRISWYPNKEWYSGGQLFVLGILNYDFSGRFQERFIVTQISNTFAGQTHLSISYFPLNDERFRGIIFENMNRWEIELSTHPVDLIEVGGEIEWGHFVYRTDNPVEGEGYDLSLFVTLKPTDRLKLDFSYDYSTLSSLDGSTDFYSGNIMRLTGRYHFSRELFFRLITQFNSFNDKLQLYPLLYYQLNPFTKFYIGMTDYLQQPIEAEGLNEFNEVNRQFFVKLQYLFRY